MFRAKESRAAWQDNLLRQSFPLDTFHVQLPIIRGISFEFPTYLFWVRIIDGDRFLCNFANECNRRRQIGIPRNQDKRVRLMVEGIFQQVRRNIDVSSLFLCTQNSNKSCLIVRQRQ